MMTPSTSIARVLLPLFVACVTALFTGCTTAPYAERRSLDDSTTLQPLGSIDAAKLLPFTSSAGSFLPTLSDNLDEGERVPFKFEETRDGWAWSLKKLRVIYYKSTPEGTVITREDDLDEEVAVTYSPAIPVLPNTLTQGKPVKGTTQMVVRNLDSGTINNKGKCEYTIELLGRHNIWTPRGIVDAVIIRNKRKITLSLVNVDVSITTAYAYAPLAKTPIKGAPIGQVGESVHQVIKLGVFEDDSDEELRIAPDSGKPLFRAKPSHTQPAATQPATSPAKSP